jgi:hypothetical protein
MYYFILTGAKIPFNSLVYIRYTKADGCHLLLKILRMCADTQDSNFLKEMKNIIEDCAGDLA